MTDTETPTTPEAGASPPAPVPGERRRLDRPPSDRYGEAEAGAAEGGVAADDPSASVMRGVVIAIVVALLGAVAIVVLGAIATVTTGLIVVAGTIGFLVAVALQVGAGSLLSSGRRIGLAIALTVVSIALGQLGIWQYALTEGGVLPLVDYLGEVFGPLVVVEFVVGAGVAWVAAR